MTSDEPSAREQAAQDRRAFTERLRRGSLGAPGVRARIRREEGHTLTPEELAAIDDDEADLQRTFGRHRQEMT